MAARKALGEALYRLPGSVRNAIPVSLREGVRQLVGPFAPWEAGYPHDPPKIAEGEVVAPPDFVGIGVQKSGTTWWFDLVTAHPGVHHRPEIHKERHYFARFATEAFGHDEVLGYQAWFPRKPGSLTGEWTPDYFYQPWVPPLLADAAPEARLMVILRDPVERFLSGLAHSEVKPASQLGTVMAEAFERGMYADPIRKWREHFEGERILVLQHESCIVDPAGQLARTYRFLDLDDTYTPARVDIPHNRSVSKSALDVDARRRLVELYAEDVEETASLVPELDLGLWPNFSHR